MTKPKDVEVEIRGKLSKRQFSQILSILRSRAKFLNQYKRLSADLSPGFDPKSCSWKFDEQIDLRVKKSGDSERISLKIGNVNAKRRQEIEVKLKKGEFLNSISLFSNLGFNKGMLYFWESWEFEYKGCEVKLSKYTNSYYTWEIESKGYADPSKLANEMNLRAYSDSEYSEAVAWENKNIHKPFSLELTEKLLKKNIK